MNTGEYIIVYASLSLTVAFCSPHTASLSLGCDVFVSLLLSVFLFLFFFFAPLCSFLERCTVFALLCLLSTFEFH